MKKKGFQLIFSFLALCVCSEIQGQEDNKKTKNTFNGSVSLNYDFSNNFTSNINLGYNRKNYDLYMDYSVHSDRIEISSELSRHFQNNTIFQTIETEQHHLSHLINLQLYLRPSARNSFLWDFKVHLHKITTNQDIHNDEHNRTVSDKKIFESSLAYKHVFEQNRHELSMNGIFSYTKHTRPSKYHVNNLIAHVSKNKESPQYTRVQMNYLKTLPDEGKLEAGIAFFSRWNKIDYQFKASEDIQHSSPGNILDHNEYILSSHLTYSAQAGKRLSHKIGLQADFDMNRSVFSLTDQKKNSNRFYLYPSLTVKYNLSENQELAFHFTRQASRPDYIQLNPSVIYIDRITTEQGNPALRPEITNRSEINYLYSGKQIQVLTTLYFDATEKFISPIYTFATDDKLVLSYTNGTMQNKIGLDIEVPLELSSWVSVNPAFSFTHTHTSGKFEDINLHSDAFCWIGDIGLTLTPHKYTEFQANFRYRSPTKIPQFKLKEDYFFDLSLRQGFLKDRLQLSFSVTDVFDTSEWDIRSSGKQKPLKNYSKEATHAYWIGLTFRFNSYKTREVPDNPHPAKRSPIRLGQ